MHGRQESRESPCGTRISPDSIERSPRRSTLALSARQIVSACDDPVTAGALTPLTTHRYLPLRVICVQ